MPIPQNPSGQWPVTDAEDQFSHLRPQDTDACTDYATINAIESQLLFLGDKRKWSERALAKMAGTTPQGNTLEANISIAQNPGLIPEALWPEPNTYTWNEYYADIPQGILSQAVKFDVTPRWNIPESEVEQALTVAPLICIIKGPGINHAIEMIDKDTFFDSYPHHAGPNGHLWPIAEVKALGVQILSYHQIIINQIPMNYKKVKFADGKTFGVLVDTPNGTMIPKATSEDVWRSWSKADSYQLHTINDDGTTDWSVDFTLPF